MSTVKLDTDTVALLLEAAEAGCGSHLGMMEAGLSEDIEADRATMAGWQKAMNTAGTATPVGEHTVLVTWGLTEHTPYIFDTEQEAVAFFHEEVARLQAENPSPNWTVETPEANGWQHFAGDGDDWEVRIL